MTKYDIVCDYMLYMELFAYLGYKRSIFSINIHKKNINGKKFLGNFLVTPACSKLVRLNSNAKRFFFVSRN